MLKIHFIIENENEYVTDTHKTWNRLYVIPIIQGDLPQDSRKKNRSLSIDNLKKKTYV